MEKILLPVDGSVSCSKAVKKVSDISNWTEIEVSVITNYRRKPLFI